MCSGMAVFILIGWLLSKTRVISSHSNADGWSRRLAGILCTSLECPRSAGPSTLVFCPLNSHYLGFSGLPALSPPPKETPPGSTWLPPVSLPGNASGCAWGSHRFTSLHVLSEQSLPSLSDVQCLDKPRCDRSRLFFSAVLGGMASPVPVAPSRLEAEVDDTLKKKKKVTQCQ